MEEGDEASREAAATERDFRDSFDKMKATSDFIGALIRLAIVTAFVRFLIAKVSGELPSVDAPSEVSNYIYPAILIGLIGVLSISAFILAISIMGVMVTLAARATSELISDLNLATKGWWSRQALNVAASCPKDKPTWADWNYFHAFAQGALNRSSILFCTANGRSATICCVFNVETDRRSSFS